MEVSWNKAPLSEAEMWSFLGSIWPAKPVDNPKELKGLLDNGFSVLPGDEDDGEGERGVEFRNFCAYCRHVGGFAWINAIHDFGSDGMQTPLTHISASGDDWSVLQILLSHGVDTNVRNGKGETPLYRFMAEHAMVRRLRFAHLLIDNGASAHAFYRDKTMVEHAKLMSSKCNDAVAKGLHERLEQAHGR